MEAKHFDQLVRLLTETPSRRGVARAVTGFMLAGPLGALLGDVSDAKKKHKRKKKKKCKGCTVCQQCKKGKCKSKPEGADCTGGVCVDGTCACLNDFKPCRGGCIPEGVCCDNADCGEGGVCQQATCVCLNGFKLCNDACIPNETCCDEDDCDSGEICLSNGSCAKTCPTGECAGGCNCAVPFEGNDVCVTIPGDACTNPECEGDADCPLGQSCVVVGCGGRCAPLC